MVQKKKKSGCLIVFLIFCAVGVLLLPLLQGIGDFLIISDIPEKSDLITAVSGPEYRIEYAAELYKKGLGNTVFFTGGFSEENQRFEASWSKYISMTYGVPEEAIVIDETTVISTYDEAVLLRNYIEAHPENNHSVILVTDPFHTRRARWIYKKVLGDEIKIYMTPVAFSRTEYSKYWWTNAESRKYVWNEYVKFTFYLLRYQYATGNFREWLSQFDEL